jgi:tetratricopeptide (TPR) repeat protein
MSLAFAGMLPASQLWAAPPMPGTAGTAGTAAASAAKAKPLRATLSGQALIAFDEAKIAFGKKDFSSALESYQRAYALAAEPRLLYNVAVCYKELGRYARAVRLLEQSIASPERVPSDFVALVRDAIGTLTPLTSTLVVEAWDGQPVSLEYRDERLERPSGGAVLVDPGVCEVKVTRKGFAPTSIRRDLATGERWVVPVQLGLLPGTLRVLAGNVPGATVSVDGRSAGVAPLSIELSPGEHEVLLRAPGHQESRTRVRITGETTTDLDPQLASAAATARLRILAGPSDSIALNGKAKALGSFEGAVEAGEHRITVSRDDAEPRIFEVFLQPNETRDLRVELTKRASAGIPAWVWLTGGAVLLASGASILYFALRPTTFEGSSPGTLDPKVVKAGTPWR